MKKLTIAIIALIMLVVGFAVADSSYSMQMNGICIGTSRISEDSVMSTTGNFYSTNINTYDLAGYNGMTQYSRTTDGQRSDNSTFITTSTNVLYDNGGFGSRIVGSESVSSMTSLQGNCENIEPFCEYASSELSFDLQNGMVESESSTSRIIQPNLIDNVHFDVAITDAEGSMRADSSIHSIGGINQCNDNGIINSIPTTESSYSSHISMNGQFSNSFNFNYTSTHNNITTSLLTARSIPCCV